MVYDTTGQRQQKSQYSRLSGVNPSSLNQGSVQILQNSKYYKLTNEKKVSRNLNRLHKRRQRPDRRERVFTLRNKQ